MAAAAAAASCSSGDGEVVLLGEPDQLNEAMMKLFFFSEDGAAMSWPAAAAASSTLTSLTDLQSLCDRHGVPKEYFKPVCAAGSLRPSQEAPPHLLCVYEAALEAGLRFPIHDFYYRVLRHYGLAPSQLAPNAWGCLAAFVLRCRDAGVEPLVSAFRYFFSIFAHWDWVDGQPAGWHHFQAASRHHRLFSGALPSRFGWKSKYFFLELTAPGKKKWNCQLKWGKPRWEHARDVKFTSVVIEKLKKMPAVDLRTYLNDHARELKLPVGDLDALTMPPQTALKVKEEAAAATSMMRKRKSAAEGAALPVSPPQTVRSSAGSTPSAGQAPTLPLLQSIAGFTPGSARTIGACSNSSIAGSAGRSSTQPRNPTQLQGLAAGSSSSASPSTRIRGLFRNGDASKDTTRLSSVTTLPPPQHHHSFPGPGTGAAAGTIGRICTNDALRMLESIRAGDDELRAANAKIGKLTEDLRTVTAWNVQYQKDLMSAGARHNLLSEEHARLKMEYVGRLCTVTAEVQRATAEVQRLKSENARLKEEHDAEKAQLKEELAAENAQVREQLEAECQLSLSLSMYPNASNPSEHLSYDDVGSRLRGEDDE